MKTKSRIFIVVLVISTLFLSMTPRSVKGSIADIYYHFENDILFNSNSFNNSDYFNIRNITEYTPVYIASYSFVNETGLNSTDITFVDTDLTDTDCLIDVISHLAGHDEVVRYYDNNGTGNAESLSLVADKPYGTIEYWFYISDATQIYDVQVKHGAIILFAVRNNADIWQYYDGIWRNVGLGLLDHTWYHIRIDFESTVGSYEGLAQYDFHVYFNGVHYGDYDYANNEVHVDTLRFVSNTGHSGFYSYFDAIGYSWLTNYSIGVNIIPIIETDTELREVDRFEFAFSAVNTLYNFGDSNADTWTDIEIGGGNQAFIVPGLQDNDNLYATVASSGGDFRGIEKNFNVNGKFINITAEIVFATLTGNLNSFPFTFYSKDTTLISALTFKANGDLVYWDGAPHTLRSDVAIETNYTINVFLNYEIDRVFLIYSIFGVIDAFYDYPMVTTGKQGLGYVQAQSQSVDANPISSLLDYIGVYVSGRSLASQTTIYGFQEIDLKAFKSWDFRDNNLFTIFANGYFHLGSVAGSYLAEETMRTIKAIQNYNNASYFVNLYDSYISVISDPTIIAMLQGDDFLVSEISIEGAKLMQESNEFFLEYAHSGIDIDESYFYVDDDNKLQFNLTTDDVNTEYIQATFDIPNLDSTDRAISFRGFRINKAFGYFVIDYLAGITTIDIPIIEKTTRSVLPANKTIDSFVILITDNDVDAIVGSTPGYVSQPILLSVSGLGLPIITASLIEMMIPLLMIIIPTLLISKGFGKEGNRLLIPLFLVFSLVATATAIIPVWIFFIIAFGTGLFLFRNKEIEDA